MSDFGCDVFPAYAGMNRMDGCLKRVLDSVPRIRGDEPGVIVHHTGAVECSPHTRG